MSELLTRKDAFDLLAKYDVKFDIVEHPPAMTTEEADKYIEGKEGVRSKTMLMAGKKNRKFYLFILDDEKRMEISRLNEITGDKLSFAKQEYMIELMGLKPGEVSILGLIKDTENKIKVYVDEDIQDEKFMTFHPNENTATIFITMDDMYMLIKEMGHEYEIVKL